MPQFKRPSSPAVLVALALLLLVPPTCARAEVIEEIVAKVNNRIITRSEFEERRAVLLKQIYEKYSGADLDTELQTGQDNLLANMITESLLMEQAETLFDMDKIRQSLIEDFRKQQKIGSDKDLEKLLAEQSMTRRDLEDQLIRLAVPNELINHEVKRTISVSENEIQDYYDTHVEEWETPATVTFREVVLFYYLGQSDEVMERARSIVQEAKGNEDFTGLVQRYSEAGTKETGGLLGPMQAVDLQETIAVAAFALEPGGITDPIDTGKSFHILRLESKTPKLVKSLDEVKESITDTIRQQKFSSRLDGYIRRIWKQSQVEVMPNYEKYLVASPLKTKPEAR
jgi:parvulin-like peptidyl-prolyl isomerase